MVYFYLDNSYVFFNPSHPLHILVPGERLVFLGFFDSVMYTYIYKKKLKIYISSKPAGMPLFVPSAQDPAQIKVKFNLHSNMMQ